MQCFPHHKSTTNGLSLLFTIMNKIIRAVITKCSAHAEGQALRSEGTLRNLLPSPLSVDINTRGKPGLVTGCKGWQRCPGSTLVPLVCGGFVPRWIAPNLCVCAFSCVHTPVIESIDKLGTVRHVQRELVINRTPVAVSHHEGYVNVFSLSNYLTALYSPSF